MSNLSKQLQPFPIVTEIRVRWGEMDAYQHVNNVVISVGRKRHVLTTLTCLLLAWLNLMHKMRYL